MADENERITVEILLRTADGKSLDASSIRRGPDPKALRRVRELMMAHGIECHELPFGVACTAARPKLALVIGPAVLQARPGDSLPCPSALADIVDQITVPAEPEFFP
jgi:hypothetical protein